MNFDKLRKEEYDHGYKVGYIKGYADGKAERPHGKWLISPDKTRACCPFCHNKWTDAKEIELLNTVFRAKNFCEYCGADLRG